MLHMTIKLLIAIGHTTVLGRDSGVYLFDAASLKPLFLFVGLLAFDTRSSMADMASVTDMVSEPCTTIFPENKLLFI